VPHVPAGTWSKNFTANESAEVLPSGICPRLVGQQWVMANNPNQAVDFGSFIQPFPSPAEYCSCYPSLFLWHAALRVTPGYEHSTNRSLCKGAMLSLTHLVLVTRRSDHSCMRLLGCEWVRCVSSTERESCLHSPTMTQTRIISRILGIRAWLGMLTGMNLGVSDGELGSVPHSGLKKPVSLGFARWTEICPPSML